MRVAYASLGVLLLLCLAPLLVALAASFLAGPLGCDYIGAEFRNCLLFGVDLSDSLTTAVTLHWLGLVTLPIAALVVVVLLLLGLIDLLRRLRR